MKPGIPKGTRDFSPTEMVRRNFIFDTIKKVYQKYGFQQIETPAMENSETLLGKYGDEGDKLVFRILNSGDYLREIGVSKEAITSDFPELIKDDGLSDVPLNKLISPIGILPDISEKALRYDLTVPFARYVVMHQNEITFPFKRYQVQPVWRADRPQKGRYREFYQCDADVIGSTSLLNEVELIQIIGEVFSMVRFGVTIKINNRKILSGIAEVIGEADKIIDITVAIDKLDKIGVDKVIEELKGKGLSEKSLNSVLWLIELQKEKDKINPLKKFLASSTVGLKGIEETETILSTISHLTSHISHLELDITLARGLNYYTGAIIEVKVNDSRSTFTSSICGGGRYDDLTGIFGLPNVSGVGISFGVDRIYDVMDEMKLFDELKLSGATTKILFVNFGNEEERFCLRLLKQVRDAGINAELYPDAAKMKKQMGYADDNKIPYVCLVGSDEMKSGQLTLKNMVSGEQEKVSIEQLISKLK